MSTVEVLEGLERKITVDVPVDNVKKAFEKMYMQIRGQSNIKGFRKGKAPLSVIKKMYKEKVTGDVLQDLINESYQEALKEHNIIPVAQPQVDFQDIDEEKNFSYTATLEIRPEVNLQKYEGLSVQKEILELDNSQVNITLEGMQKNMAETVPVLEDRSAQNGDVAVIDFDGYVDGEPLEGGKGENHNLELGSNTFIPGFEEGILGMTIDGEKEVSLSFPDDYHVKEIAGKPVVFKVKLNKIMKKELPELNDEFAQKVDEQFKTLDELKEKIKENMAQGENQRIEGDLKERVLKALVNSNPVDVPKSLHKAQKNHMIEDLKQKMSHQNPGQVDFQEYVEKWDSDFDKTASFIIQSNYLVSELAQKLDLQAKPEDVDKKLEEYSQSSGYSLPQLKEHYHKPENFSQIHYQVTEEKVVNFLIEKASLEEVKKDQLKTEE